ncbi:hypothetical protein PZA11_003279 [Diplocarpon coronariae]|uniref:Endoglucanase n=1 Tax=Diplocarpon coronariae TaxID=2795749 RepID=A0A218YZ05_9HELO|nr:hypothetical protein JHW43_003664 [Diplocarpon mali]OWP01037.1 hypothetical protein B2J93_6511 [Marssonina coronariae]
MVSSVMPSLNIISLLILLTPIRGHTFMQNPVPFASQLRSNGPMSRDGSDWPCSGEKDFDPAGVMNIWQRGSTQYLQAMGGASHGGGSCQISVTRDMKPTRYSEWKVIHSIHGGCPIRNLADANYGLSATALLPSVYNFTIPDWLHVGQGVMAWTWYGRWSVPEMYMNCAPIMILGGGTDTNTTDAAREKKFDAAPLIFEANNGNGCWTANQGSCVEFPEPGDSLEVNAECPLDQKIMFTGVCNSSRRLALLSSRWYWVDYKLSLGLVLLVSMLLTFSIVKLSRKRGIAAEGYNKVPRV